jgi:hypothetical protein
MDSLPGSTQKWRLAVGLTLAAKSCASVNQVALLQPLGASAVGAARVEAGRDDQISASDALTFGDRFGQRRNRVVAHELRKERQLALLLGRADAKLFVCFRRRLIPQCSHDRQSLTRRFAGRQIVPLSGWKMRDEL